MSKTHRNKFTIYKDESSPSTLDQSFHKSQIPLAARTTRSMTRLSSVLAESENHNPGKLAHLARSGKNKSLKSLGDTGSPGRKVLGSKMNVQTRTAGGGLGGLKRRGSEKEGLDLKRMKVDGLARAGEPRGLPKRTMRTAAAPSTPVRNHVPARQSLAAPPTPARELLSAKMDDEEEEDDDEPVSGFGARFIARPPTPPRPHMGLHVPTTPARSLNTVNTPTRPASGFKHIPQTRIPAPTLTQSSMLSYLTPRAAAQPPRTVVNSSSKENQSPTKYGRSTTPAGSPSISRPMMSTTPSTPPKKVDPLLMEDTEMPEVTEADSTIVTALQDETSFSEDTMDAEPSYIAPPAVSATATDGPQSVTNPQTTATEPSAMLPLSRIPRPTSVLPRPAVTATTNQPTRSSIPVLSKSAASTAGLGRGLPSAPSSRSLSNPVQSTEPGLVKRKPSYPSSLGSGPLARPRDRLVSGPTLYPQQDGSLGTSKQESNIPKGRGSPRSVSEPAKKVSAFSSLTASTSRREGLSLETSRSIAGLSDALNKLKVKKANPAGSEPTRPRPSMSIGLGIPNTSATSASTPATALASSSRLSSVHRPRQSVASGDVSMADSDHPADRSLAAIMHSTTGANCFKGVVAYVDVHTSDGDDASPIFAEMLKSLGARVLSRLTENVTHVVYKSGKPQTLAWFRKQEEDERPHVVGISWVTRSKEKGEKLDEAAFAVKVEEEDIFQKRRKSMEPKALAQSTASARPSLADTSLNLASMRRKSLMYAPKISSPLKTAFRTLRDEDDDE